MGVFDGALLHIAIVARFSIWRSRWHVVSPTHSEETQLLEWLCIEARTLVQHRTTTEGEPRGTVLGLTVLVNSSESEGQCNALLEAMQAGIPILARDNAGNSRIIQHGVTGWLWHDPHDCIRLARELCLCAPSNTGSRVRPCSDKGAAPSMHAHNLVIHARHSAVAKLANTILACLVPMLISPRLQHDPFGYVHGKWLKT